MRTGKSSMAPLPAETTEKQVKTLIDFLVRLNNEPRKQNAGIQKKPETQTDQGSKPAAEATPSGTVAAAGRQFYDTQGCAKCHAIGGKGGTSAPPLSDVGKRLSKGQLTEVIQKMWAGKSFMPPLPGETTEQQVKDLIDFLVTLNNEPQKQNAGIPKKPETPTDQTSKPAAQPVHPGTVAATARHF